MSSQLKEFLLKFADFDSQELEMVCRAFKCRTAARNTVLLRQGQICKDIYFISTGSIRTFYMTKSDREKTRLIILEGSIGTSFASFLTQSPSFESIEVLEDSEMLSINYADFYQLLDVCIHFKDFYQKMLEMAYLYQNKKIEQLVTLTAKQRFDLMMKENPILIQRLSNKVLASYLDIREETLSRIKSK